jgi:hypothetical protein
MNTCYKIIGIIIVAGMIMSGCKKEYEENQSVTSGSGKMSKDGTIVLGKQRQDPFSIENIKQAYNNLLVSEENIPAFDIVANHVYIRFLPKDSTELRLLQNNPELILFQYPLDYEILEGGLYYHDPNLPASSYTWMYTSVKKDKKLPAVPYEIIRDLYIPPVNENNSDEMQDFYEKLYYEACRIAGYVKENAEKRQKLGTKYLYLKIKDEIKGTSEPLKHLRFNARVAGNITVYGGTDANGFSQIPFDNIIPDIQVLFYDRTTNNDNNRRFEIYDNTGNIASYSFTLGSDQTTTIEFNSGNEQFYGMVFLAACNYSYYSGLKNPKGANTTPIKIYHTTTWGNSGTMSYTTTNNVDQVNTYIQNHSSSKLAYSMTIRGLAQASFRNNCCSSAPNNRQQSHPRSPYILDWGIGVQWVLTNNRYPGFNTTDAPIYAKCTGYIQDLIDGKSGYDQVNAYATIQDLETKFFSLDFSGFSWLNNDNYYYWRDQVKTMHTPPHPDVNNVDAIFAYWGPALGGTSYPTQTNPNPPGGGGGTPGVIIP